MLDASLKTQLKAYLEKVVQPIELVAALDDSAKAQEMAALLQDIVSLSDKITLVKRVDAGVRLPSFSINRAGTDIGVRFAGVPMGHEFTSLVLALLLQILLFAVILTLSGYQALTLLLLPWALIGVFSLFLKIIFWSMIISVILSWVAPGSRSPGAELVAQITEPVLAPFRRLIPNLGGLDISPIFAFIAIQLLQSWVIPRLAFYAFMPKELFGLI